MSSSDSWDFAHSKIQPFTIQSQGVCFSEWVSLFTLSLSPLIVHIIAGSPKPSYLCQIRPKWYERISHYNPTSILWRYAAITDRRIRARAWSTSEMAASCALFWTAHGWDGSEAMVDASLLQCTQLPVKPQIRIFSKEMLKTVVGTLQGAQAVALIVSGIARTMNSEGVIGSMAMDIIFFPIAVLGFLRLPAALWLTEDFEYGISSRLLAEHDPQMYQLSSNLSMEKFLGGPAVFLEDRIRFCPVACWASIMFRVSFTLLVLSLPVMMGAYVLPWSGPISFSTTSFLVCIFYTIFSIVTAAVMLWYFARGATSTLIPCINSAWYKAYTLIFATLALGVTIVACLETRKTPCGRYTSNIGIEGDYVACWTSNAGIWFVDPDRYHNFGIARTILQEYTQGMATTPESSKFWVYNFTGACIGNPVNPIGTPVVMEATNSGNLFTPEGYAIY